jgi:hypothetical protein
MLKNYLLLFTLFVVTSALSQTYTFDYMLEYRYTNFNDTIAKRPVSQTTYRFINSQDNTNCLMFYEAKGTTYIQLLQEGGKYYRANIPTEDFFVEAISMKCPQTGFLASVKYKTREFEVLKRADTIINTQPFSKVQLMPVNKKKFEKLKIDTDILLVDNSLGFKLPLFEPYSLIYRLWKDGANVPNGILKEVYSINAAGKKKYEQKLVQILPLKKVIIIDKNCK